MKLFPARYTALFLFGATMFAQDPHSFAKPNEAVVRHLNLDVKVDFDSKIISGKASLTIENKSSGSLLYLDSRGFSVTRVTLGSAEDPTNFFFGTPVKFLGQPLVVAIKPDTKLVNVYYATDPSAAALQWLEPSQTAGKKDPFLFTQSEAIMARTWVPCQDGPGIRMTYSAKITARSGLLAVMSASNPTKKNKTGVYEFSMKQPIPSYLLALAVGDIEFRSLGKRSGVYAEPSVVKAALWELKDTERMIKAAEKLYGPYRWERYDLIILPPSFPFGGMENPRLTFATPTIIAGDRSLVGVVAHELAHSWSGNLVTNATWNDIWMNEGFTSYFENRIMEEVYGKTYAEMLAQLAYRDLKNTVKELGEKNPDTQLKMNLLDRDPDEGLSDIAYVKGMFFLKTCEQSVGRSAWDAFLKTYFDAHAFQSMTTEKFAEYVRATLCAKDTSLEEKIGLNNWLFQPGLPANCVEPKSPEFSKVEAEVAKWTARTPAKKLATRGWTTHHWLHFLSSLPDKMTTAQMAELDGAFTFTKSGNAEILAVWLQMAIKNSYAAAYPALEKFLTTVGRRKFLRPLYTELAKTPEGMERARAIYAKARPGYHSVSFNSIDGILKWGK